MPLTLILVRHERRDALDRTFHSPLLPEGRQGAVRLAQTLCDKVPRVDACYVSPFLRCRETLDPYMQCVGRHRTGPCGQRRAAPFRACAEYALYERVAAETEEDRQQGLVPFDPAGYIETVPEGSPHRAWLDALYTSWLAPEAVRWDESEM